MATDIVSVKLNKLYSADNKFYAGNLIDNLKATGQVKVNGLEWTARAADETDIIPQGTEVTINGLRYDHLFADQTFNICFFHIG